MPFVLSGAVVGRSFELWMKSFLAVAIGLMFIISRNLPLYYSFKVAD